MDSNTKMILGVILATVVLAVGMAWVFSRGSSTAETKVYDQKLVLGEGRNRIHQLGSEAKSASDSAQQKVMIVEFSDFQCPACKVIYPDVKQLLKDGGDSVALYYRHFPLPQHLHSTEAAIVSEIAAKNGKFSEMADLLFEKQEEWGNEKDVKPIFTKYLTDLGVSGVDLNNALSGGEYKDKVEQDKKDANMLQINATPTFFVNNQKVEVQDLTRVVREKLK